VQPKLTSILCADVDGYNRRMQADQEATTRTLSSHRKVIDALIEKHRGKVVNPAPNRACGDFDNVLDAVNCSIDIQDALKLENGKLPSDHRMEFRIGINLGMVRVESADRITGNTVNAAARLQSRVEPGGICISDTVYTQIKNNRSLRLRLRSAGSKL
jgi:adenylate cyclase